MYQYFEASDASAGELNYDYIRRPDSVVVETLEQKYSDKTNFFKAETIATKYGNVNVDSTGKWTYTQNTQQTASLGSSTSLNPRFSISTPITATLSDVDLDLSSLAGGSAGWAEFWLSLLQTVPFAVPIAPLVKGLETKIPLDWSGGAKGFITSLFESTPYNAYVDGEVQSSKSSKQYTMQSPKPSSCKGARQNFRNTYLFRQELRHSAI